MRSDYTRRWARYATLYQQGNVAIVHGVGYENSPRSHFRSMDIWHTCEPDDVGTEGWLGKVIQNIDPNKENVVTGVSFGPSMFRAMAVPGVPVACVEDLNNYGLMPGISAEEQRQKILNRFSRLYGQAIGRGPVMEFLGQTGLDALQGADILKIAPERYSSDIEYADTTLAKKLEGHRAGAHGRPWVARFLLRPWQLRLSRWPAQHASRPVGRPLHRHQ